MRKVTIRILVFLLINILFYVLYIYGTSASFSESVCHQPSDSAFDFIITGSSQARVFSSAMMQQTLQRSIRNISIVASGIIPQKIRLSCFYKAGNTTKHILYFIDPWALFMRGANQENFALSEEPIDFTYLEELLANKVDPHVLYNYFRNKLTYEWAFGKKLTLPKDKDTPEKIVRHETPQERIRQLYSEPLSQENFNSYATILTEVIFLAKKHNTEIIFIIPPTALGTLPGHHELITLLREYQTLYGVSMYDFSEALPNPSFYTDYQHLSEDGARYFAELYIKDVIREHEAK